MSASANASSDDGIAQTLQNWTFFTHLPLPSPFYSLARIGRRKNLIKNFQFSFFPPNNNFSLSLNRLILRRKQSIRTRCNRTWTSLPTSRTIRRFIDAKRKIVQPMCRYSIKRHSAFTVSNNNDERHALLLFPSSPPLTIDRALFMIFQQLSFLNIFFALVVTK